MMRVNSVDELAAFTFHLSRRDFCIEHGGRPITLLYLSYINLETAVNLDGKCNLEIYAY